MIVVAVLVAAFAAGGLLLSQTAYRGGLGAPLAVVTLANPLAAAVIGLSCSANAFRAARRAYCWLSWEPGSRRGAW